MRKKHLIVVLALLLVCALFVVACDNTENPSQEPSTGYDGPCEIRLTAIGSTTIKAGKTLQIRASVTGTNNKDVVFESSDESIATVSDRGVVTGKKAGTVSIVCKLVEDNRCQKSIQITVEQAVVPTSIAIGNADSTVQWVGEELQLNVSVEPAEASSLVNWTSSATDVATVSESGLVEFLKSGEVTITATSQETSAVSQSVTFNVKKGIFRSDLGSPYWNIADQCADENPNVSLDIDESQAGYHSLYASGVSSTRFYVEANFRLTEQVTSWVWQGFGVGGGLSETSTRYFIFSPRVDGQGNDFNKFIVKDLPNETWGAITTRSQTWGENGLNNIDYTNSTVKVAMLRDGNTYYYLINDKLMYVDESMAYDDVPTMPIIVAIDVSVKVTDYVIETDNARINEILDEDNMKKSFYASNSEIVEYDSDEMFIFKSNNVLSKDNKVKSLGDSAKLVGDFEVEFDVSDMLCSNGHTNSIAGLTVNFSRYESADTVETFVIGKSANQPEVDGVVGGFLSWNYQKSMEDSTSWYSWLESSNAVYGDTQNTHHVKLTRTIENNVATFRMWVDNVEVEFDTKSSKWAEMTSMYTGAYILWVGGEYTSAQVTNFRFQSNLKK